MDGVLIHLRPYDPATETRVDVYVGDGGAGEVWGLGDQQWEPAIKARPATSLETMDPSLMGKVQAGRATFALALSAILSVPNPHLLYWTGAPVTIYAVPDLSWPRRLVEFSGSIEEAEPDKLVRQLSVKAKVDTKLIDQPLLRLEFDGGGGLGGDAGKRGTRKPAGFGVVYNVPIVWFDEIDNIGMIDGYGNTVSIDWLGEGLNSLGARVADYATYAALKAAIVDGTVPRGRWATCVAQGLVGLGAPPVGIVTCHAVFGANRPGSMMKRMLLTHAQAPVERVLASSFDALDLELPYTTGKHFTDQVQVSDLLSRIAASCNATPLIDCQGRVLVTRATFSAPVATLDYSGATEPRVSKWKSVESETPYYLIQARTAQPGVVLTHDQVNYGDTLEDRGLWRVEETYRLGQTVWMPDGSQWLYTNDTAGAGQEPPIDALPDGEGYVSDFYWFRLQGPRSYADGTPYEALKPATPDATAGAPEGTTIGGTINPDGTITGGKPAEDVLAEAEQMKLNQIAGLAAAEVARLRGRALHFAGPEGETYFVLVSREQTTRESADEVFAETISLIGAQTLDGSAFIMDGDTVRVLKVEGEDGEETTVALATRFSTINAKAGESAGHIENLQQILADPEGGVTAVAILEIDVAGRIVGYRALNSPTEASFIISAQDFQIVDSVTEEILFQVIGGLAKMHNVEVDTIKVGSVTTGSIAMNAVTDTSLTLLELYQTEIAGGTGGVWQTINYGGTALSATVDTTGAEAVVLWLTISGHRSGDTDDAASYRIRRVNDGVIPAPSSGWTNLKFVGDINLIHTVPFIDNDPLNTGGVLYVAEFLKITGSPIYERCALSVLRRSR